MGARKQRVAVRLQAAFVRQLVQQPLGGVVDQVLGQIGKQLRRVKAETRGTPGVCRKGVAQVKAVRPAKSLGGVRAQRGPAGRLVGARAGLPVGGGHAVLANHAACISASSFSASAMNARMPSASFSVAMASWFSASRKPASS